MIFLVEIDYYLITIDLVIINISINKTVTNG